MPSREHYESNDGTAQLGSTTLMQIIGGSKHITAGWAGFAAKTLLVCTSASSVFGLASWMVLQGPLGPCLSFLAGSGFGFVGGLVSRWRSDVAEALLLCRQYPQLIEHHIRINDTSQELQGCRWEEWAKDLPRNPRKQGLAVAAMYSASPAIERIRQEQEEALVAAYVERYTAGGDAGDE